MLSRIPVSFFEIPWSDHITSNSPLLKGPQKQGETTINATTGLERQSEKRIVTRLGMIRGGRTPEDINLFYQCPIHRGREKPVIVRTVENLRLYPLQAKKKGGGEGTTVSWTVIEDRKLLDQMKVHYSAKAQARVLAFLCWLLESQYSNRLCYRSISIFVLVTWVPTQ